MTSIADDVNPMPDRSVAGARGVKFNVGNDPAAEGDYATRLAGWLEALPHDDHDLLAAKFDALGERITHVHVNHLDPSTMGHPRLAEIEDELLGTVDRLRELGFDGSSTIEFVAGLLTEHDHPAALLDRAADDLAVVRRVLEDR